MSFIDCVKIIVIIIIIIIIVVVVVVTYPAYYGHYQTLFKPRKFTFIPCPHARGPFIGARDLTSSPSRGLVLVRP